mmetsp:Transcript_57328/g.133658  ORF Transcript_57328/g.133658 Transcript_57328/m.133658 type:complete len:128 (+) Transcript_57328:379-762(+)
MLRWGPCTAPAVEECGQLQQRARATKSRSWPATASHGPFSLGGGLCSAPQVNLSLASAGLKALLLSTEPSGCTPSGEECDANMMFLRENHANNVLDHDSSNHCSSAVSLHGSTCLWVSRCNPCHPVP